MRLHAPIASTAAGLPLFIASSGIDEAITQLDEHLSAGSTRPGYELGLFHALDASSMSFHSLRRSNRPDAHERPYLVSHAFLVGGPGEERESARFYFEGVLMSFRSGSDAIGCDLWIDGRDRISLPPDSAVGVLKSLLSGKSIVEMGF
ncbi:hypothetical protein F3I62_18775 [Pseudomonas sp. R-28-1W-6]|uniref:hypothetical protein n=1 Tax=Pseudomonas sp. R-28-1W-6 TaxID=2650101 RepID=UPI0013664727|nr:hypothetical protein [Pseudomonas sp. R-28-1W-6]MWV14149.1 hypothetical protein [Pseudomonas sp. R-28-1W-6]